MRKGQQQSWNTLQLRLEITISVSNTARSACYIQGRSAFLSRQPDFTLYFELLSLTTLCLLIFMFNFFPEGSFKLKNVTRYDNGLPNPTSKTETRTGKYVYRLMRVREQFRFPEKKKTLTWHGRCAAYVLKTTVRSRVTCVLHGESATDNLVVFSHSVLPPHV